MEQILRAFISISGKAQPAQQAGDQGSERRTETTEGRSGEAERDWEPIGDLRKHWRKIEGGEHRKELSQQRRLKPGRRPLHLPALLQWSKRNRSGYHWHADATTDAPDD
jgi:hypothetical protein